MSATMEAQPGETVKIFVKTIGGNTISLDVAPSETIDNLKSMIEKLQGIPSNEQRLALRGKCLENGSLLSSYNIGKKATLLMVRTPAENEKEKEVVPSGPPVPCANGCGFFGNPQTENMCSKCYNTVKSKPDEQKRKDSSSIASDAPSANAVNGEVKVNEIESSSDSAIQSASSASSSNSSSPKEMTRCQKCNKRVGITIIKCRCGYAFCGKHRYSDQHDCTYDYKEKQKKELTKDLEKVAGDKLKNRMK